MPEICGRSFEAFGPENGKGDAREENAENQKNAK